MALLTPASTASEATVREPSLRVGSPRSRRSEAARRADSVASVVGTVDTLDHFGDVVEVPSQRRSLEIGEADESQRALGISACRLPPAAMPARDGRVPAATGAAVVEQRSVLAAWRTAQCGLRLVIAVVERSDVQGACGGLEHGVQAPLIDDPAWKILELLLYSCELVVRPGSTRGG